jgi:hypothetical protein
MKRIILILNLLTYQIYANELFTDFTIGASLFSNISEYEISYSDSSKDVHSSEVGSTRTNIGIGYSYDLSNKMVFQPTLGFGSLNTYMNELNINKIYSLELPLLFQKDNNKYGFFVKYNYLTNISMELMHDKIKLNNQSNLSLGFKTIFENKNIDFILAYEYMLPGIYEQNIIKDNEQIHTKFDIEGSYITLGARFRF